jgi:hypothetical protein
MFPATTRRVTEQTADSINESIRRQTDEISPATRPEGRQRSAAVSPNSTMSGTLSARWKPTPRRSV